MRRIISDIFNLQRILGVRGDNIETKDQDEAGCS